MTDYAPGSIPTYIRLYGIEDDGTYYDMRDTYDLDDFGGVLPVVGDLIIDPGVLGGLDRKASENRTVLEVAHRHIQPSTPGDDDRWIVLVCNQRPGLPMEADIVTRH